ncbi:hypothetical protein EMIT048CA2_30051 [Pseudomonas chlororaphis]|uniref:hypothetical protein n=1 Tax=Pseudomonas TaxID=286 RepID=UPI00148381F0|nr:hypothetical protein [Pseudomonas sp. 34 E 7]
MSMLFSVKGCVGNLLLVALFGCSSTPKVTLPEPKDVPREKWSDAMLVLEAMRIDGQRDIPLLITCPNGCMHTILDGIGLRTSDLPRFTTRTAISVSLGSSF